MKDAENRLAKAIPFMVLAFAIVIASLGYYLSLAAADRAAIRLNSQEQAIILCESQNNTQRVLLGVLESLVEPREDDEPGDYQARVDLFEQIAPTLQPIECNPPVGTFE